MSNAERWRDATMALHITAKVTKDDLDRMAFTEAERANVDRGFAKDAPASAWLLSFSIMFRVLERMANKS